MDSLVVALWHMVFFLVVYSWPLKLHAPIDIHCSDNFNTGWMAKDEQNDLANHSLGVALSHAMSNTNLPGR